MHQTYLSGKYGFTVDYARLDIIYRYGGIYLDTDVELLKPLDGLLGDRCFMGFETQKTVALGLGFGAEAGNETILSLLKVYNNMSFIMPNGELNLRPSPGIQTEVLMRLGLKDNGKDQIIDNNCHVYPKEYFNPCNLDTREITVTDQTISIHHYAGSWLTDKNRRNNKIYSSIARFGGVGLAKFVRKTYKKYFINNKTDTP